MIKQKKGNIINIASMSGTIVNKGRNNAHYCASKGGVKMLTKALAAQWSKYNIRVNSISPGYIRTPLSNNFIDDPDFKIYMESFIPMKRVGKPEEIVGLAIFVSSDASSFLTGAYSGLMSGCLRNCRPDTPEYATGIINLKINT